MDIPLMFPSPPACAGIAYQTEVRPDLTMLRLDGLRGETISNARPPSHKSVEQTQQYCSHRRPTALQL